MSDQIPNRLAQVPDDVIARFEDVLSDIIGFDVMHLSKELHKRLWATIRLSYSRGYENGYRDGHTDAENGHDERVRAVVS